MRRFTITSFSVLTFVLGTLLAFGLASGSAHQDANGDPLAGTTVEALSMGLPAGTEGDALILMRVTMEPGTIIPPHQHPGPVALYVESGVFGTEFFAGTGQVTRAATSGTPEPAQELVPGDDITMQAGDHLFYDGATHTMRNDGDEPLVLLVSALFATDQPGFVFVEGTPVTTGLGVGGYGLVQ